MQISAALIAASLAISAAMAVPTSSPSSQGIEIPMTRRGVKSTIKGNNGQVDWNAVQAEVAYLKAKYSKSLDNYQRNTGKAHELDARPSLEKRSSGTVSLTDVSNEELWTGTMAFGTSAQSFQIGELPQWCASFSATC
jgi:cathepsin D